MDIFGGCLSTTVCELETDLNRIANAAKALDHENLQFRQFIRHKMSASRLDKLVKEILADIASKIDCTKCGNCCRESFPTLTKADTSRLAKSAGIATTEFFATYLKRDDDGDTIFRAKPCPLLVDNKCSHYEARPEACRSYPHLHKSGFAGRSIGVIANFEVCPIVFNVVQKLKLVVWGHR
jgi:Fe-S-cluster containining protein